MTPEQKARANIDGQLAAVDWLVQDHKAMAKPEGHTLKGVEIEPQVHARRAGAGKRVGAKPREAPSV